MKLNEVGERPPGVLRTYYDVARAETCVYLNGELAGTIPDRLLMDMTRDGLVFDWNAWRAAKLPDAEHRREEKP